MVGRAALIRVSSLIRPLRSKGTLKSTRMKTCVPRTSISRTDAILDMPKRKGSGLNGLKFSRYIDTAILGANRVQADEGRCVLVEEGRVIRNVFRCTEPFLKDD